ncbi:phosphate propanoyltransferase [Bacillus shivajii]|uniref:phosphate propanoyltransferase n=1 Tax=Bacillus shivajii TaxID=1983719 RepID=UPI001CF9C4DF|nr:phosphate propanoyltransferase [Bacillus shivajii]UCZ52768.1 phosphate propanoyltransferase [Bacillus shivajii]
MDQQTLKKIIEDTIAETLSSQGQTKDEIPIAVSNRHVHLSEEALERLFGKNYQLRKLKDLSQPGQYACEETVTVIGPKGRITKVRILGPARGESQVEVSLTDGRTLGIDPPIRNSGDIEGTPGVTLLGPRGRLQMDKGLICARRHIHMHPSDAEAFQVNDRDVVSVKVDGERGITYDNTLIRVSPKYRLEMHIDFDEANAGAIGKNQTGKLFRTELS